MFKSICSAAVLSLALAVPSVASADSHEMDGGKDGGQTNWLPSLQTETPTEGFALAVKLARRAVKTTQPEIATLKTLRPTYARDADSLIAVSRVVSSYFDTIAEANDYWRE